MNINNVYLACICVKTHEEFKNIKFPIVENYSEGKFVKKTLIYVKSDIYNRIFYVDIESGKKYINFDVCDAEIGELYVVIEAGLIPYKNLIDTNRKNMSKRRILKKYNDYIKNIKNENNK